MSGDIGRGATRETVSFAVHMASVSERPPGKQANPRNIFCLMWLSYPYSC